MQTNHDPHIIFMKNKQFNGRHLKKGNTHSQRAKIENSWKTEIHILYKLLLKEIQEQTEIYPKMQVKSFVSTYEINLWHKVCKTLTP